MATSELFAGVLPFVQVAEALSFRRAAERLGVSAAAVSKAVLRLEESLGVKLLVRTSRSVALTPEGALFLERCRQAVDGLEAARELMAESRRSPRGQVHLSMPFILGARIVPALPRALARYPHLAFRLSMTDRLARVVGEKVDVAVRIGPPGEASLVVRKLADTRWVVVGSPGYLARAGAPAAPGELEGHNCLRFVPTSGRPRGWSLLDRPGGAPQELPVRGSLLIDQGEHLLQAALAGLGLCQVLDFMALEHLRAGRLMEVLAPYAAPGPQISALAAPERRKSPNVRAVFSFLAEVFGSAT